MSSESISTGSRLSFALRAALLLGSVAILGSPGAAHSASIFPSAAPDYYSCTAYVPLVTPTHFYVLASGYPFLSSDPAAARQGLTGAAFRIDGIRSDQFIVGSVLPAPGGTVDGDFLGAGGRISFAECHPWESESCLVLLLDITVLSIAQVSNDVINVRPPGESCSPSFDSAFLSLCDGPVATQLCARTGGMCVNTTTYCVYCPLSRPTGTCTLPVTSATWSSVKALFH